MQEDIKKIAESLGYEASYYHEFVLIKISDNENEFNPMDNHEPFNPYENSADAFMVLSNLINNNSDVTLLRQGDYFIVYILTYGGIRFDGGSEKSINAAICTAYLSLIGEG